MSRENVEIVRAAIEALNAGDDWEPVLDKYAGPNFEFDMSKSLAFQRGVYGREQTPRVLNELRFGFEAFTSEPHEFIELGEHVVVPMTTRMVGRDGVEVEARTTWTWTIRNGSVERICLYQKLAEALEAARWSEKAMPEENVELVNRLYRAMDARDVKTIEGLTNADAEWIPDPRVGHRPVRGRDEIIQFFLERAEMFGELSTEVERAIEADDRVLAFIRVSGQGAASGAGFEIRVAHLWTIRNGLVVRGEGYGDRDQAMEAAGLSE